MNQDALQETHTSIGFSETPSRFEGRLELSSSYRHLFGENLDILFEERGASERSRIIYAEALKIAEALPFAGEVKLTDNFKRELVIAALELRRLVNSKLKSAEIRAEEKELIERADVDSVESIWSNPGEISRIKLLLRERLVEENLESALSGSLRLAHAENMITVMEIMMEQGELAITDEEKGQFLEDVKRKNPGSTQEFCQRVYSYYERLVPKDRPLSLIDRRDSPLLGKVRGFELSIEMPSNYEVAERFPSLLPPAISPDRVLEISYLDRDFGLGEVLKIPSEKGEVLEFSKTTPPKLWLEALRHEFGHSFAEMKSDFLAYLDWVGEMLKRDRQEFGRDIFSSGISSYPILRIRHEVMVPGEVVAEIWCHAADSRLRSRIIKELPHESRILFDLENPEGLKELIPGVRSVVTRTS